MKILLTLDYELFFNMSGSVEKCILEPTLEFVNILSQHDYKACFFVDAGYLRKLEELGASYPQLAEERKAVVGQLEQLAGEGHDLQLHIHSHWEDTVYDGEKWNFDMSRYRLHAFSEEINEVIAAYKTTIEKISGKSVFAYRAGGWSAQPFSVLAEGMKSNGILVDSSVFYGGLESSSSHFYDFRRAPKLSHWRFSDDLLQPDPEGPFYEFPIASFKLSPLFFWRMALIKLIGTSMHQPYGDGAPIPNSRKRLFDLLFKKSHSVVSIDGFKASYLKAAYKRQKKNFGDDSYFVIIGHPKAFSRYSLKRLNEFLKMISASDEVITYEQCI